MPSQPDSSGAEIASASGATNPSKTRAAAVIFVGAGIEPVRSPFAARAPVLPFSAARPRIDNVPGMSLPLAPPAAPDELDSPRNEGAAVAPTVLVVDDERNIRRTLDLVLRGEGYDVIE